MALGETLTGPLAIGVGCRAGCPAETIVTLVEEAMSGLDPTNALLFTLASKAGAANLQEAARRLRLPLTGLPVATLAALAGAVTVRSERVARAVGVPSVAEAAALAGAGPGARLLVPRRSRDGATCAVAVPQTLANDQSL